MSYLRRSIQKLNASNSALNAKLTKLNEDFEDFKKGKDQKIQHCYNYKPRLYSMKNWLLKSNSLSLNSKTKVMSLSNTHDAHASYSHEYLSLPRHRRKTQTRKY